MNIRTVILVMAAMILLGLVSSVQIDGSDGVTSLKASASGISNGVPGSWDSGGSVMQDDGESDGDGEEGYQRRAGTFNRLPEQPGDRRSPWERQER